MNSSTEHNNWITVGEVINLVRKPLALYTDHVVKKWHSNLRHRLKGGCANPIVCKAKIVKNLCHSCNQWYNELVKRHRAKDKRQIKWRKNCDTSKWPDYPWEVAKFFMPVLGDNKKNTKDAESTDLSSLLNVLEWMDDVIFSPDKRVSLDLVRKLRSDVRNTWAHEPHQKLALDDLNNAFDIANEILAELDVVFKCKKVTECIKDIKFVQVNQITNVIQAELNALSLLRNEQAADVAQIEYCIPGKPCMFIGRDAEVKEIISYLVENAGGIVSIVGGPGFGKSSVAIEVSHQLNDNHDIIVIFSFLSNVSTVPDVFLRLCQDVGVDPGEDSKSSFMLWLEKLRKIKKKVVLVMDNIEQLLEEKVSDEFTELVLTLRKNSEQQLQILATTRTVFSVPNQPTKNIEIGELDVQASVEILRKYCPNKEVEDTYLCALANLCGFIPLALCITGSRIPRLDDPAELIQWLEEKPMKALQSPGRKQCVRKAIEFSFQMLSEEDKKAFARLSVFNGNFQRKSAQEVIVRNGMDCQDFLEQLVHRSLLQTNSDNEFVIHLLIRRFLADHDQLQDEKAIGEALMVRHFLKLCHLWTMKSYSKGEFTDARRLLKKNAHNVEEMLKICFKNKTKNPNANVIETLASSEIYNFSSRFFFNFARDLLPQIVLRNFYKSCLKLAESRKQPKIEITFQCLVAKQEGQISAYQSPEYIAMMKAIKEALDKNKEVLKGDGSIYRYCYYFYARYYSGKKTNDPCPDLEDDFSPKPENMDQHLIQEVDEVLVLLERAYLNKRRAAKVKRDDINYEEYMTIAQSCCKQALSSAKDLLGEHELTCACHKWLGDLYLTWKKHKEAITYYSNAIRLRRKLKLDSNEPFVYLLKNYALCFSILRSFEASVENLSEAREIADKLAEKDTPCRAQVYYQLAKTYLDWKNDCQEAAKYAKVAMEMQVFLHDSRDVKTLKYIIKKAEYNMR